MSVSVCLCVSAALEKPDTDCVTYVLRSVTLKLQPESLSKWEKGVSAFMTLNQSIFYFISVHIEVILDKNKKLKHIINIYNTYPTGL